MRKADVLKHYKTATAVAEALDISVAAVSQWGDLVPPFSAKRLALLNAALPFNPALYRNSSQKWRRIATALSA